MPQKNNLSWQDLYMPYINSQTIRVKISDRQNRLGISDEGLFRPGQWIILLRNAPISKLESVLPHELRHTQNFMHASHYYAFEEMSAEIASYLTNFAIIPELSNVNLKLLYKKHKILTLPFNVSYNFTGTPFHRQTRSQQHDFVNDMMDSALSYWQDVKGGYVFAPLCYSSISDFTTPSSKFVSLQSELNHIFTYKIDGKNVNLFRRAHPDIQEKLLKSARKYDKMVSAFRTNCNR